MAKEKPYFYVIVFVLVLLGAVLYVVFEYYYLALTSLILALVVSFFKRELNNVFK